MEIYRNQPATVKFRAPIPDGSYSIKVKSPRPGGEVHETMVNTIAPQPDASLGAGAYSLTVPVEYSHTFYDGTIQFEITVMGGTPTVQHTYTEYVDVVTPLFTWDDLGGEYPEADTPELERLVRKVVENRTGQRFGRYIKTVPVDANQNVVNFNVPLLMFVGVSDLHYTGATTLMPPKQAYEVIDDGYSMAIDWDLYDVKTDSMWILKRRDNGCYLIHGEFGWNRVPEDVKQAALLIAGVWGCKQAVWRDRYIETMRSSDWAVTYNDGAFASTGSVTADQLLSKYARNYMPEVF